MRKIILLLGCLMALAVSFPSSLCFGIEDDEIQVAKTPPLSPNQVEDNVEEAEQSGLPLLNEQSPLFINQVDEIERLIRELDREKNINIVTYNASDGDSFIKEINEGLITRPSKIKRGIQYLAMPIAWLVPINLSGIVLSEYGGTPFDPLVEATMLGLGYPIFSQIVDAQMGAFLNKKKFSSGAEENEGAQHPHTFKISKKHRVMQGLALLVAAGNSIIFVNALVKAEGEYFPYFVGASSIPLIAVLTSAYYKLANNDIAFINEHYFYKSQVRKIQEEALIRMVDEGLALINRSDADLLVKKLSEELRKLSTKNLPEERVLFLSLMMVKKFTRANALTLIPDEEIMIKEEPKVAYYKEFKVKRDEELKEVLDENRKVTYLKEDIEGSRPSLQKDSGDSIATGLMGAGFFPLFIISQWIFQQSFEALGMDTEIAAPLACTLAAVQVPLRLLFEGPLHRKHVRGLLSPFSCQALGDYSWVRQAVRFLSGAIFGSLMTLPPLYAGMEALGDNPLYEKLLLLIPAACIDFSLYYGCASESVNDIFTGAVMIPSPKARLNQFGREAKEMIRRLNNTSLNRLYYTIK